jgi:hypothetical protein
MPVLKEGINWKTVLKQSLKLSAIGIGLLAAGGLAAESQVRGNF